MYRTILVPLDGSELAEKALPIATALAEASGTRLILVRAAWAHVLAGMDPTDAQVAAVREAEAYLSGVTGRVATLNVRAEARTPYDNAADGILMEVNDSDADLVVMCTHGRSGLRRLLYGSVAEGVIRCSPCAGSAGPPNRCRSAAKRRQSGANKVTGAAGWLGSCRSYLARHDRPGRSHKGRVGIAAC